MTIEMCYCFDNAIFTSRTRATARLMIFSKPDHSGLTAAPERWSLLLGEGPASFGVVRQSLAFQVVEAFGMMEVP
ncbi:MAG: hypothetical protein ING08_10440 [Roseomonas sp.]|nr:hypothetical protein [Roseomonas sp.]MCA3380652.1 hypothetical protein [Roseomonas sp.]